MEELDGLITSRFQDLCSDPIAADCLHMYIIYISADSSACGVLNSLEKRIEAKLSKAKSEAKRKRSDKKR